MTITISAANLPYFLIAGKPQYSSIPSTRFARRLLQRASKRLDACGASGLPDISPWPGHVGCHPFGAADCAYGVGLVEPRSGGLPEILGRTWALEPRRCAICRSLS